MTRPMFCPECYTVTSEGSSFNANWAYCDNCGGTSRRMWVQEAARLCGQWVCITSNEPDPFDSDEAQSEFAKVKHLFPRYYTGLDH